MAIHRSNRRVAGARLAAVAADLLDASTLCAIATVDARGQAHVNTAYFAWSPELELVWLSDAGAQHSQNIEGNDSAAIAVFDSGQTWGSVDRGIQLFGHAAALDGRAEAAARSLYTARFPGLAPDRLRGYRLYRFRADRLKLFDEAVLGGGTFVTARLEADRRPVWEKTEVYGPDA
jgi:uncharacterized protein YhbP (UPF0306 family)